MKVFSAFVDPATDTHGLCLQYVPGADLGVVIRCVYVNGRTPDSGRALIEALDAVRRGDSGFDPAALRDRESLATDDFAQAVCRVGERLAEALAFAHAHGILHCDIKPGNILLTPYGRPMLADFNVAFDRTRHRADDTHYGGTLAYMAPEYRAVMFGQPGGCADERCDIYSLGVVLYELATGTRPQPVAANPCAETLIPAPGTLSAPEVGAPAGVPVGVAGPLARVPRELAAVIHRCLAPDPTRRYQTAGELASALSGAWHLLTVRRAMPQPSPVGRWVLRRTARGWRWPAPCRTSSRRWHKSATTASRSTSMTRNSARSCGWCSRTTRWRTRCVSEPRFCSCGASRARSRGWWNCPAQPWTTCADGRAGSRGKSPRSVRSAGSPAR